MIRSNSGVAAILAGVALLAFSGTAAADDDDGRPGVYPATATGITTSGAELRAYVYPNGRSTTYRFEYGASTAYGAQTTSTSIGGSGSWRLVTAAVSGLASGTTYHFRMVAVNSRGTTSTSDQTFSTAAAPSGDPVVDPPPGESPPPTPITEEPQAGVSVGAAPGSGTVLVRVRGSSEFEPLTSSSVVPFGSELDASRGSLSLTSVLPSGKPQTGAFGGGRFVIRKSARGYVDLHLRGRFCPPSSAARGSRASAVAAGAARPRRLWGRDSGGRFRTHGKNSHATVRGTRWMVEDRCNGTLTRVTEGSVVVRDLVRDMRTTVRAGDSYLARPAR